MEKEKGGRNSGACAACRHQRKKCKVGDCVLWPYFRSDRMGEFQAVHRVFGLANMTRMIRELEDKDQREAAAKSLLWEAETWAEDPVHGPLGRFNRLQQELEELKHQLSSLRKTSSSQISPAPPHVSQGTINHSVRHGPHDPSPPQKTILQYPGQVQEHVEIISNCENDGRFPSPYYYYCYSDHNHNHNHNLRRPQGLMWPEAVGRPYYNQTQIHRSNPLSIPIWRPENNNVGPSFHSLPTQYIYDDKS